MAKRKHRVKKEDFLLWKAKQLRSNWRRRAKKFGKVDQVPEIHEIHAWLVSIHPFKCYLTNEEIKDTKVEFDHVRSISRGGSFRLDNVKPVSHEANAMKADMTLKEYYSLLRLLKKWSIEGRDRFLRRLRMSRTSFRR